jgi:mannose-6-phosphate isomerase-like protein (cupin superfamily)
MPYEPRETALNAASIDVSALVEAQGEAPWSVPVVASPRLRTVALALPPGLRPAHRHPHADELFQVISGSCGITIGDGPEITAVPGMVLLAEQGVRHQVSVPGPGPVVLLCTVAPNEDRPDEQVND